MEEENIYNIINLDNTYIGYAPIDVDDCQWIRSLSGDSELHFLGETYDKPKFAIGCRGLKHQEVKERSRELYNKLKNYIGEDFVIITKSLPHIVGKDESSRFIYSFNIEYQLGGF